MENLPPPLFAKVINYLKLAEKVNLRLVCKEWTRRIDEECKLTSIFVCNRPERKNALHRRSVLIYRWIDTNHFVDLRNVFMKADLKWLFVQSSNRLLDSVRNLTFHYLEIAIMNRLLARFRNLRRLQIQDLKLDKPTFWYNHHERTDHLTIDQPNLQVLIIIPMPSMLCPWLIQVTVNAPALKFFKFHFKGGCKYTFTYPQSIEHLELEEDYPFDQAFKEFVNLKILVLYESTRGCEAKDDLLRNLTSLKELHFFDRRLFDPLMRQKHKYKLNELKLYLCGLQLADLNRYTCELNLSSDRYCVLAELNDKRLQLLINNYLQMANQLYFEKSLNYDVIRPFYSSLPVGFLKRFTRLTKVKSKKVIEDEDQYCQFLMQCPSILSLQFDIGTVSERLMKRIVSICPYLLELRIMG